MRTKYLSKEERQAGTRHYLNWATYNGLGFSFLGDTTVYLMALHFGATNTQVGYLTSLVQVSGISLLLLPQLLAGINLVKVQSYAWIVRGLVCLFYGLLFFLSGQVAVTLIMVIHSLFCIARTFGTAVSSPIQRMLATPSTIGEIVVNAVNRFQSTRLLSQFLSVGILSIQQLSGILGYLFLMALGVILNTISAFSLRQVPCREVVDYRRGKNVFALLRDSLKNRERALTLFVKWHVISLSIVFNFAIPFLRKLGHFPPNLIFLYTIIGTLATISASYGLRPFTDRIGSRPVIILASFCLALVGMLWGIISPTVHWSIIFLLGFLATFLLGLVTLLTTRLEIRSIPEKDKVGYVSMMNFFSAFISLIVGISGGMLADLGEHIVFPGLNPFGLTFFIAVFLSIQNGVLCFFLQDPGSLSVKETANILFSTRNLKAFLNVYQLNMTSDPVKRKTILLSIGKNDTSVAAEEIRRILNKPLSAEKDEMLKSLFAFPKPELLPDILREAASEQSYYRMTAIFTLGSYPDKEVERMLLKLLQHPSTNVRSTAAKSLARIGNTSALDTIRKLAAEPSLSLLDRLNYLIAVSIMDKKREYLRQLFDVADHQKGKYFEQAIFSLASRMLDFEPPLGDLYQEENIELTMGVQQLFEESKQLQPFFEHEQTLLGYYSRHDYENIWRWCREKLSQERCNGEFSYLNQAIQEYNTHSINKNNTLAALYFTYQIILSQTPPSSGR